MPKKKLPLTKTLIDLADSGQSYEAIATALGVGVNRIKTAIEEVRPLVAMNQTISVSEIAEKLGAPRQTIHQRLTKAGYTPLQYGWREKKPLPPDPDLLKMYKTMTMSEIAKELDINIAKIQERLDALGADTSRHYGKGGQKPKLPETERVKQLFYTEKKTAEEIAEMFGATPNAVYKRLEQG